MRRTVLTLLLAVAMVLGLGLVASAGSINGREGAMPAFYDDVLHTINFKMLTDQASASILAHNKSVNHIFMSDTLVAGQPFVSVIDAIQGDGFNPLWQEVDITFLTIPPQQFTNDADITAAADAHQIELTFTNEVYRCSVIGPKL